MLNFDFFNFLMSKFSNKKHDLTPSKQQQQPNCHIHLRRHHLFIKNVFGQQFAFTFLFPSLNSLRQFFSD